MFSDTHFVAIIDKCQNGVHPAFDPSNNAHTSRGENMILDIISDSWAVNPDEWPNVSDIVETFQAIDINISDNAHGDEVRVRNSSSCESDHHLQNKRVGMNPA